MVVEDETTNPKTVISLIRVGVGEHEVGIDKEERLITGGQGKQDIEDRPGLHPAFDLGPDLGAPGVGFVGSSCNGWNS